MALELAQRAVKLDTEHQYDAAVMAYGQSLSMLAVVMDNLQANIIHRRVGSRHAKEEELRRLGSIVCSLQFPFEPG
jgi:hypothetical protein